MITHRITFKHSKLSEEEPPGDGRHPHLVVLVGHGGVEVEQFGGRDHRVFVVDVQDAGVEQLLLPVFLLERGEDQRADAVRVQVDEGKGFLHFWGALEDVRLHVVAFFVLLALLFGFLGLVDFHDCALILNLDHLLLIIGLDLLLLLVL